MLLLFEELCSPCPSSLHWSSDRPLVVSRWVLSVFASLVGDVPSMGSPGEGADMLIVGVVIGTTRAPIESAGASGKCVAIRGLSILVAIGSEHGC
jgi:hypothetical protein